MAERFMRTGRRRWLALMAAASGALVFTFSRAAWLGAALAAGAGGLLWLWRLSRTESAGGVPAVAVLFTRKLANLADRQSFVTEEGARNTRPVLLALVSLASVVAVAGPLLPWLLVRADLSAAAPSTEVRSLDERAQLTQNAKALIAARPFGGVGAGRCVPAAARLGIPDNVLEPVHNVPLLVTAETGP
jgi:hypothetical protein